MHIYAAGCIFKNSVTPVQSVLRARIRGLRFFLGVGARLKPFGVMGRLSRLPAFRRLDQSMKFFSHEDAEIVYAVLVILGAAAFCYFGSFQ